MKLLVTGGSGFIGSNFVRYWLDNNPNDKIINLDKLTYASNPKSLKDCEDNPNYTFIKGDICDRSLVQDLMRQIDTIVHFAAETHVDNSIADAAPFVMTNFVGTYTLLEAARTSGMKRFHHISTDEVFGALQVDTEEKFTEMTAYQPRSPYSASKAGSDHLMRAYYHTYGLPITISNCSNNFGPYQHPEKLIPLAVIKLIQGKKVPVYGDGMYYRDWLYVDDHCSAIELILKRGKLGETYLVGGMTQIPSNLDLIKKILKLMNMDESMIEFVKDRPGHDRRYDVNWSKIQNELGWQPKHDFDFYLNKTIAWYKDNREWWNNFLK